MCFARSTVKCCEMLACSIPRRSMSAPADSSPSRRRSTMAMRVGWASAWKNSALKRLRASCIIVYSTNRIYDYCSTLLPGDGLGQELAVGQVDLKILTLTALDHLDLVWADGQSQAHGRLLRMLAAVDQHGQPGGIGDQV